MKLWTWKRTLGRPNTEEYMHRYQLLVLGNLLRVYVNHIIRADDDPRLHTHPYRACWSFKLWGFYVEQVGHPCTVTARIGDCPNPEHPRVARIPGFFSRIPWAHRIVYLSRPSGVWTLFIGWRRDQPWGFINNDGSVEVRP